MNIKIVGGVVVVLLLVGVIWYFVSDSRQRVSQDLITPQPPVDQIVDLDDSSDDVNENDSTETDHMSSTEKEFTVDSFMYGYSPNEIVVNEGDTVTINLINSEGMHDWVVDEFGATTEIIGAGEETSVTFVADKAGEFEFYCSVGSHRAQGMVGTLIVQ